MTNVFKSNLGCVGGGYLFGGLNSIVWLCRFTCMRGHTLYDVMWVFVLYRDFQSLFFGLFTYFIR